MSQQHTPIVQDQEKFVGDKPSEWQEKKFTPPVEQKTMHPLEEGTVERAKEFEERRVQELDAEREEHNRRTAGGDPQE